MDLLDEVRADAPATGQTCSVALLPDELREEVDEVLAQRDGRTVTVAAISRALKGRGHDVKRGTLSRHASKECACDPR